MTQKKLFEILNLLGNVSSTDYKIMQKLFEYIKAGTCKIIKKQWGERFKNEHIDMYPLDLTNFDRWCTYDNNRCVSLEFATTKDGMLLCIAKIYDGGNFDGYRKELRFMAELILPSDFIQHIQIYIEWALDSHVEDAYDKHLEDQKRLWMHKMKAGILKAK